MAIVITMMVLELKVPHVTSSVCEELCAMAHQ